MNKGVFIDIRPVDASKFCFDHFASQEGLESRWETRQRTRMHGDLFSFWTNLEGERRGGNISCLDITPINCPIGLLQLVLWLPRLIPLSKRPPNNYGLRILSPRIPLHLLGAVTLLLTVLKPVLWTWSEHAWALRGSPLYVWWLLNCRVSSGELGDAFHD